MKKPSQSRSQADRFADLNEDVSADQKWQDELQVRWQVGQDMKKLVLTCIFPSLCAITILISPLLQSFLQRVRVHEMLKCLHGEHRKLQVNAFLV